MKLLTFITSILFIVLTQAAIGQVVTIKGRVLDQKTKQPVMYANVGIEGTLTGGASNTEGYFEFKLKTNEKGNMLYVSAVGYETIKRSMSTITADESLHLEMKPKTLSIAEVDVSAESLVLYQRMREVAKRVEDNYLSTPFLTKCYYHGTLSENGTLKRERKAALDIYDATGYRRESKANTYNHLNYAFREVKKNFDVTSLGDGMTMVDEMLEFDIVRNPENILATEFIRNFDLRLESETVYEGANVWVISYKLNKPNLTSTGDYYATQYAGKIYISKTDYAVVKNETWVKASKYNKQGRSIVVKPGSTTPQPKTIDYHFTAIYRKVSGKYILALIRSERNHIFTKKKVNMKGDLLVTELVTENANPINGRDYFTDKPYNPVFWDSYNFILD